MPTADMSVWQGRDDTASEGPDALRIHQCISPWALSSPPGVTLLGFACDEGVRRNYGRAGAAAGPASLRRALANLAWPNSERLFDAGDVPCREGDLEEAQEELAKVLGTLIRHNQKVITLGGGHETAWGTFLGVVRTAPPGSVGIINLDAHFDLRPSLTPHSGTPFRQMAEWSREHGQPFHYLCLGIAEPANTRALFQSAKDLGVSWLCDHQLAPWDLAAAQRQLADFLVKVDLVYLSIDLDVLPAAVMPAVSAPSGFGVPADTVETVIQWVAASGKLTAADVVEFNPTYDTDGRAARVAARLLWQLARHWAVAPHQRGP